MTRNHRKALGALLSFVVVGLGPASAQDKSEFREQAKATEAQFRRLGEPKDRCSLEAFVADGAIISRAVGSSALKAGDRLLSVKGVNVAGKSSEDVLSILRSTGPVDVIAIAVERDGQQLSLDLTCTNSRPSSETLLQALVQASKGKFEECASTLTDRPELGTPGMLLQTQCASFSRKLQSQAVTLTSRTMQMLVEDARWVPAGRIETVRRLRAVESTITRQLGQRQFEQLVEMTRSWPGGETLYDDSEPDWGRFRTNAEAAVIARLLDPESARIEWPYGFLLGSWQPFLSKRIEGYWTCGLVNARNRMGGYTGSSYFVVVLDPEAAVRYVELGESKDFDFLTSQCKGSVDLLPRPPAELLVREASAPASSSSLADELKKLADLRASGAINEEEFQAAKKRLLETPAR